MGKFLKKVLIFFLLLPFIWVISICLYGSLIPRYFQKNLTYVSAGGYTQTRLLEADTTRNIDILTLGSSHTYRGFDPRIFREHGIRMFNLGSSAQSPLQTQYLVQEYINRIKPGLVIYEVSSLTFSSDGLESALDLYRNVPRLDKGLLDMAITVNKIKSYNTFLYALFRKSFEKKSRHESAQTKIDTYIPGGYVETKRPVDSAKQMKDFKKRAIAFNGIQTHAFEETMRLLQAQNIKVILVQAPVLRKFYQSITNESEFETYFSSFKGIPYYNFNEIASFNDDQFYDHNHLNQQGVNKFNKMVIDTLAELSKR